MKNILKGQRGVSLISLGVAIIIMIIITSILVYNAKDTTQINKLNKMYDDISNLRAKISTYYARYGTIPAKVEFTSMDNINILGANDIGGFYIIDLSAIDGLTLNYGQDYNESKDLEQDKINKLSNIYIINKNSHNIFYVKGVTIDGETYYTDQRNTDKEKVDLRYVDGIKIPDGYYYVGKTDDENKSIVISSDQTDESVNTTSNKQYKWVKVVSEINNTEGTSVKEEDKENFLESANEYMGYFTNFVNSSNVVYSVLKDETLWSPEYKDEGTYTDEDDYTAYIPAGFCVSTRPSMNKIKNGLVVKEVATGNEYVWIEVSKSITADCLTYDQIEKALQSYTQEYRKDGYTDTWYNGCGISDENDYNNVKYKMLLSIKENGGFYIGRYETGSENERKAGDYTIQADTMTLPIIQKDKYIYKYITIKQAQELSTKMSASNYTSSLMFGIQWDLVCKFIANNTNMTIEKIITDSSSWGNYNDKNETGKSIILNILDLADNNEEITLENYSKKPTVRGGNSEDSGNKYVTYRKTTTATTTDANNTFRITLFK